MALTARLADEGNWWAGANGQTEHLRGIIDTLDRACEEADRDPASPVRTLDLYSLDPLGVVEDRPAHVLAGSIDEIAASLLALADPGIHEVRVDVAVAPVDRRAEAVEALTPVAEILHGA